MTAETPAETSTSDHPVLANTGHANTHANDWQALPLRARAMFICAALLAASVPALIGGVAILRVIQPQPLALSLAGAQLIAIALFAVWLAHRRYRYTFWKLDSDGFAVRQGRLWQRETRVPTSRVQHLDLKRGPIERSFGLATLIVHTAGTRLNAVSVSGLDNDDAERLRDRLGRLLDHDDDAL